MARKRTAVAKTYEMSRDDVPQVEDDDNCLGDLRTKLKNAGFDVLGLAYSKKDFFIWETGVGSNDSDHIHVFFVDLPKGPGDAKLVHRTNMNYTVTCKGKDGKRATHIRVDACGLDQTRIATLLDQGQISESDFTQEDAKSWGLGNPQAANAGDRPRTIGDKRPLDLFADWVKELKEAVSEVGGY